jgi:uncharacterized protein with LGFP repeats
MSSQDITDKYDSLSQSDRAALGAPMRTRGGADSVIPEQDGLVRNFKNGAIYSYLPQGFVTPNAFAVFGPIFAKWMAWGGTKQRSWFGLPLTDCVTIRPGAVSCEFQRGVIASSPAGVCEAHDAIFDKWKALNGVADLGLPIGDQTKTAGVRFGLFNDFENGSIFWVPGQIGPIEVRGDMLANWRRSTAPNFPELGPLGYPVVPQRTIGPGTTTNFQDFENGTIYEMGASNNFVVNRTPATLAHNFAEIGWDQFGTGLSDGDVVTAAYGGGAFPQFPIKVTLTAAPAVTKLKTVALWSPAQNNIQSITVGGATRTATMTIAPGALAGPGRYLIFQKEKQPLIIYTYLLPRPDRLIGSPVTFNWVRD